MKKILVPTDFSPIADQAIQYAMEIAAQFECELLLYHIYSLDRFNYDVNLPRHKQPHTLEVEKEMKKTRLRHLEKANQLGISLQSVVVEDSIASLFRQRVLKHDADLIIMGSKGATGLDKVVFGSVATTAIEVSRVPTLVIPTGYAYRPLKHIVLAIDKDHIPAGVVSPLLKLAMNSGATVTVLNVNGNANQNGNPWEEELLKGVPSTYKEIPKSHSINDTINQFIDSVDCDMLCMIRRQKHFYKRLFRKSITREQGFSSQIPLLVLPENPDDET